MNGNTRLLPLHVQPEPPNVLRLAGWAFVVGSLAAYAYILLPPRPMDAQWEFVAMTQLADNALLPLLGIALVLHGRIQQTTPWELTAFRALVVFAIGLGLFFLALIPLAIGDSQRVENAADGQLALVDKNEAIRMRKAETQLRQASTLDQLRVLGIMLNLKPAPSESVQSPAKELESLRKRLLEQIAYTRTEQIKKLLEQRAAVHARVGKDSVKIVVIAFLACGFYFRMGIRNLVLFRPHVANTPE